MRLVFDTNVIISALIWGGIPQELVELAFRSHVELITSRAMLDELANVLSRGKFANELPLRGVISVRAVDRFASGATIVIPQPAAGFVPRDPDDDAVLGTALAGRADLRRLVRVRGAFLGNPTGQPDWGPRGAADD